MPDPDLMQDWNEELETEATAEGLSSLVVYSRDWTVETIVSQITKGNIDLTPSFQRRNAWDDHKRSRLIESLIIRVPVPEIVLAEDKNKKGSFIVIDGKQRLLAIAGFFKPNEYKSWQLAKLRGLYTREDLNDKTFDDLEKSDSSEELRQLQNSDIRCTVISNYKTELVLYDVFYRLNTGSVPLSSQELRQVLNRGPFANYLIEETNVKRPIHSVMNLSGPDARLRDAEILLRYIGISMFGFRYSGNLTNFLDQTMQEINSTWEATKNIVAEIVAYFHKSTEVLLAIFPEGKVGRKYAKGQWESRFNRALYEVQCYYFTMIDVTQAREKRDTFIEQFEKMSIENPLFNDSIESTTKSPDRYYNRFKLFENLVNTVFEIDIDGVPVPNPADKNV